LLLVSAVSAAAGSPRPACALLPPEGSAATVDSVRHLASGTRWTLVVPLSNPSDTAATFRITVQAPLGWTVSQSSDRATLPARGHDLGFVSLSIGRTVPAGEGVLHYAVDDGAGTIRRDSVRYLVGERRELSLAGTAPAFAPTGATYLARFVVSNRGNTTRSYGVRSVAGVPAALQGPRFRSVRAGAVDTILIKVHVPSGAPPSGKSAVTVRLQPAVASANEDLSAFVQTTVFATGGGDPWVRLPVQITPSMAGRDGGLAIEGHGPLGRGGVDLDLVLRGPRRPTSITATSDEYHLALVSPTWRIRLGDQALRLTPLTESGRAVTGASAAFVGPVWSASLGSVVTRQFAEATHLRAQFATIGVQLPASIRLQGTALVRAGRADSGAVGAVQLAWSPSPRHVVEVEGDRAQQGGVAWRARLGTSTRRLQLRGAVLSADTAFPGYTRGTRSVDGFGRVQLTSTVWLRGTVDDRSTTGGLLFGRDIANPDTLLAHEPLREHRYRSSAVALGVTRLVQLEARWKRRDDPLGAAAWGAEQTLALSSSLGSRLVRLSPRIEIGEVTTSMTSMPSPLQRASLDLGIALGRWGALSPSAGVDIGRSMYDTTERRSWHAGAQLELHSASTRATIGGQYGLSLVAGPWTPPAPSRRADASIIHELRTGDELSARLRWDPQARALVGSDVRLELGYRLRLRVPVGRPQHSGWVRGRVQGEENGEGLRGVIVRLDDRLAMTGDDGEFQFSGVPAGRHVLDVDSRTLGEGRLVRDSALRTLEITNGRESDVTMTVVRGGRIAGRLLWFDEAPHQLTQTGGSSDAAPTELREAAPPVNLLLTSGSRTVRVTTDATGHFEAGGLEPGRWLVRPERDALPPTHRMESGGTEADVPAGDSAIVAIRIVPRPRTVHILTAVDQPSAAAPVPPAAHMPPPVIRRREVPLETTQRKKKPVVRDVPLLPAPADAPRCPWPVVRPNGPICQEPTAPDSISTPPTP
jgi:hypothetical protein